MSEVVPRPRARGSVGSVGDAVGRSVLGLAGGALRLRELDELRPESELDELRPETRRQFARADLRARPGGNFIGIHAVDADV